MPVYQVGVIIPTLNEERFIERCINSVIQQTYPFEQIDLMIIDGGSKDSTREIVQNLGKNYPNIRLIHNPGKIQSIAFNIGVKESSAPYIVRLDAHALYDKEYIERCINRLGIAPELGNIGGKWIIQPSSNKIIAQANAILNQSKFGIGGASFRVSSTPGYVDTVPFGAFRRSVVDEVGGMREDLDRGEDNEYNSRIRQAGYKVFFDPDIISTYYARESLGASARQMYANGLSIGRLLFIDRKSVGLRHLVPFIFVLSLIVSFVAGYFSDAMLCMGVIILVFYFIAAFTATFVACLKFNFRYLFILPVLFFIVHLSYGWGTIIGILKGK